MFVQEDDEEDIAYWLTVLDEMAAQSGYGVTATNADGIMRPAVSDPLPVPAPARVPAPVPAPVVKPRRPVRHPEWRLGTSLHMWRAIRSMTQSELARRVGVSRRTISGIENLKHEPTVGLALAIAEVFDVPVHDIFSLRRPKPRHW